MAQLPRAAVERFDRLTVRPFLSAPLPVKRWALGQLARAAPAPRSVAVSAAARGGVPGELLSTDGADQPPRILYLHGGGYEAGSPRTHRAPVGALVERVGASAFVADYRLAPEHECPAAIEDAVSAYSAMAEGGIRIAIAGDSAGGGLVVALAVALREGGLPAPAGLALISPWVDLAMTGASFRDNADSDALLKTGFLATAARRYAGTLALGDPRCSPLHAELAGLSPMLIHAGSKEMLRSDAEELARRAQAAGVDVRLRIWEGLWHGFQIHAGILREADEALDEIGVWLRERLADQPAGPSA